MIAGVCAGLGDYLNIDPTVVRLLFVLAFFLTGPGILLAYLIMAAIIPPATARQ
jgi:phage shock protein PspC (stress-responsive transcriptional regulator)